MGKKLRDAPVYYTVAQVQFGTVLNLKEYLPHVQDGMRKWQFPVYHEIAEQQFVISTNAGAPSTQSIQTVHRYAFGDLTETSQFVLDRNSITFHTSNYISYTEFADMFHKGLELLANTVNPSYLERIGIRYVDAILPKENQPLSIFLAAEVQGLSRKITGELVHTASETVIRRDNMQLISRVIIQRGVVGIPHDFMALPPLLMQDKFNTEACLHAILDIDASRAERTSFTTAGIMCEMQNLHDAAEEIFHCSVSAEALDIWN